MTSSRYWLIQRNGSLPFLLTLAFSAGIFFSQFASVHHHWTNYTANSVVLSQEDRHTEKEDIANIIYEKEIDFNSKNASEHSNLIKEEIPVSEPIAIQQLKTGFSNPQEFSILRTDVDDLYQAFKKQVDEKKMLPRLVVSFTSLPKRFDNYARRMIEILKQQKYVPDHIYVAVPEKSRRSNETFEIPSWIGKDPLVTVLRPKVDLGPATKLIPALRAEEALGNYDTRIVTVDDDNEGGWFGSELLELLAYSLVFENEAIGFTGWNVTCMVEAARCNPADTGIPMAQFGENALMFIKQSDDFACHTLADYKTEYYANCMGSVRKNYAAFVDVLEGYRGVLYQPKFFNLTELESLTDSNVPEYFFFVDDVWFSGWLGVRNVRKIVVSPAINDDSDVFFEMKKISRSRNLSIVVHELSEEDKENFAKRAKKKLQQEEALHSIHNFQEMNLNGSRWFDKKNAWTKDLWKRPKGFFYESESQPKR